jgi:hypothetical protein
MTFVNMRCLHRHYNKAEVLEDLTSGKHPLRRWGNFSYQIRFMNTFLSFSNCRTSLILHTFCVSGSPVQWTAVLQMSLQVELEVPISMMMEMMICIADKLLTLFSFHKCLPVSLRNHFINVVWIKSIFTFAWINCWTKQKLIKRVDSCNVLFFCTTK